MVDAVTESGCTVRADPAHNSGIDQPSILQARVILGDVVPPAERGMPDLVPDLASDVESLSDILVADRDEERRR